MAQVNGLRQASRYLEVGLTALVPVWREIYTAVLGPPSAPVLALGNPEGA
jgi:hypothetical protein